MNRFSTPLRFLTIVAVALGLAASLAGDALADPAPPKTITLKPEGNKMAYATTKLTAQPGQKVTIVFENTASSPAMQHNVVVLNTNEEAAIKRVGQAAASASNYVPDDPAVLAATGIAKPGETTKVTFTVPDTPGEYTYVCTYPGHYVSMQGTLIVKE